MDSSFMQNIAVSLFAYALWHVTRSFLSKSPLSNIPGPPNTSWLKGHFDYMFNKNSWAFHRELREKYGHVIKVKGLFGSDHLYLSDPLALHHIFVEDQYTFEETQATVVSNNVVIGICLQSTIGEQHKKQRKMLNPAFSTKHMREMLPVLYPIAHQLRECLKREVRDNKEHTDVIAWISRTALEYIGQGGLGYSFSALDIEKKSDSYADAFITFFPSLFRLLLVRQLSPWIVKLGSPRLRERILDCIPFEAVKEMRKIVETLENTSRDILRKKREAIEKGDEAVLAQVGKGKDIMSILLKANAEANLPESEFIGQMSLFVLAGHDTTTNATSRILHLLALNLDVQSKLREEVTLARKKYGDLDYDTLQALPYLDAVCRETMRAYPPVPLVDRVTNKDVVLPLKWSIRAADGKTDIREIIVPKGTGIMVPISGANSSKEIWGENAEEWLPERWLKPLPESVADAHLPGVYSQMMTFIGGGRACIGFKFSEMEMKMILSVLLETFIFEPGPDIFWQFSFIYTPVTVGTTDDIPRLPLKVSLVQS
ncbi:hypothetical protein M0805_001475 [Coniferiporia weirii]|nr:hypothetical protein M0805_001475 [Coniferiporia weirii]